MIEVTSVLCSSRTRPATSAGTRPECSAERNARRGSHTLNAASPPSL